MGGLLCSQQLRAKRVNNRPLLPRPIVSSSTSIDLTLSLQRMYARLLQRLSGSAPSQSSEPPAQVVITPESRAKSSKMPLGLLVLHHPHIEAKTQDIVSIIFVHGLGGSATGTWIHSVSKTFWPTLLHKDDRLMNARISTF